jgi:hypothetical protein
VILVNIDEKSKSLGYTYRPVIWGFSREAIDADIKAYGVSCVDIVISEADEDTYPRRSQGKSYRENRVTMD